MADEHRLSDQLLRHLMAVGQVDILVGLPTLNNAATIASVVRAVHRAFGTHFLRDRTLLLNSDGGSADDTPALVRSASIEDAETVTASHSLRTTHRISVPYHGVPGKGSAIRQIFAAADLTQARVVVVLDPTVSNFTPESVAALIQPVRNGQFEYVSPIQPRHPLDGALVSQLVRPIVRATYGWRVAEPLAVEFAGAPSFVAHCIEQDFWDGPLAANGIDMWITGTALSGGFRSCEVALGRRLHAAPHARLPFSEVFQQVVGSVFGCLEAHEAYWAGRAGSEPLPLVGERNGHVADPPSVDGHGLTQSFREDVANLRPVLASILSAGTLDALDQVAAAPPDRLRFDDGLWVKTVYEFLSAYHAGVMNREHITQALAPLYLGRAGSFLIEHAHGDAAAAGAALDALGSAFEDAKAYLLERWREPNSR